MLPTLQEGAGTAGRSGCSHLYGTLRAGPGRRRRPREPPGKGEESDPAIPPRTRRRAAVGGLAAGSPIAATGQSWQQPVDTRCVCALAWDAGCVHTITASRRRAAPREAQPPHMTTGAAANDFQGLSPHGGGASHKGNTGAPHAWQGPLSHPHAGLAGGASGHGASARRAVLASAAHPAWAASCGGPPSSAHPSLAPHHSRPSVAAPGVGHGGRAGHGDGAVDNASQCNARERRALGRAIPCADGCITAVLLPLQGTPSPNPGADQLQRPQPRPAPAPPDFPRFPARVPHAWGHWPRSARRCSQGPRFGATVRRGGPRGRVVPRRQSRPGRWGSGPDGRDTRGGPQHRGRPLPDVVRHDAVVRGEQYGPVWAPPAPTFYRQVPWAPRTQPYRCGVPTGVAARDG